MAYYSKESMHRIILIHLFQRRTAESLLENQLKNTQIHTVKVTMVHYTERSKY